MQAQFSNSNRRDWTLKKCWQIPLQSEFSLKMRTELKWKQKLQMDTLCSCEWVLVLCECMHTRACEHNWRSAEELWSFKLACLVLKVLLTAGKLKEAFPVLILKSKRNESWQNDNCHPPEVSHAAVWRWSQSQKDKKAITSHRGLYLPQWLLV